MSINDETWYGELQDLLEVEDGLTGWELNFIEDMSKKSGSDDFVPSEKQKACIGRIWDRVCK